MTAMLVGYMRVSKADGSQTLDLQRDALLSAGVDPSHIYEDHASGRLDDRPGITAMLKALREGDTLVVWKLDRLGRDLRHLVNLKDNLALLEGLDEVADGSSELHGVLGIGLHEGQGLPDDAVLGVQQVEGLVRSR